MNRAKLVNEIMVTDPDTKNEVNLTVYKHQNDGMFAMDSSFLDQCTDEDSYPIIPDPFEAGTGNEVMLVEDNALTDFISSVDLPQD